MQGGDNRRTQLTRVLGSGFAVSACVGTIIGLGFLRTPGEIVAVFQSPASYIGLWLGAGLFVLLSTAVVAELVGMTPRSGGYYPLVRHALGPYPGFLIGWADWLAFTATIALKVTVLAEYIVLVAPDLAGQQATLAILITSAFAALQLGGIRLGAGIQQAASAGLALIVVGLSLALMMGSADSSTGDRVQPAATSLTQYGLVLSAVVFTYDGWLGASYFSGEIKGGGGAVARACVKSVLLIVVLYVLLNSVLALSVPLSELAGHELALAKALDLAFAPGASTFVIVAAIAILLAHQNLNYMQGPRVFHALAVDGLGLSRAAAVGPRGNPLLAVLMTWLGTVGLVLAGGFEFLLNLNALLFVLLYLALFVGVLILRKTEADAARPFMAWGHPFSTIVCILGWTTVCVIIAVTAPESAISAAVMIAVSGPVYWSVVKHRQRVEAAASRSS